MTVKDPASIVSAEQLIGNEVEDAKTATISCVAKENPLPKVSWLEGDSLVVFTDPLDLDSLLTKPSKIVLDARGTVITSEVHRLREKFHAEVTTEGNNLRLDVIYRNRNSVDVRNFKCQAENGFGLIELHIHLDEVENARTLKFADEKDKGIELEASLGQKLELNCEIDSSSKASVRWAFVN